MNPIHTVAELDAALSDPTPGAMNALRAVQGDVLVLGAGGKLGPTLAIMARRALDAIDDRSRRVVAVSRFRQADSTTSSLRQHGVDVIACDLANRSDVASLPDAPNVIYLVGQKFGTSTTPEVTWFVNTVIPAIVAERFAESRMVVLSTGCVYPLSPIDGPGSRENDPLNPPGEYANSCVGRERIFEYYSKTRQIPMAFVRLCYAIDLRYGVLLDIAQSIWRGQPIDLTMGATHVIWQRDANARILQCLEHVGVPPVAVNVTGRERLSIRQLATRLGGLLNRDVQFTGCEGATAWVWDAGRSYEWFGPPSVSTDDMLSAIADWVMRGGETLNRPTHFEVRDGQF